MDWFKKHADTVTVLIGILSSVLWMNGKFNDANDRFNTLEKDVAIVKTVLIMKDVMPHALAKNSTENPEKVIQ